MKKLLAVFMSVAMIFSLGMVSYANDIGGEAIINGEIAPTPEEYEEYLNSLTDEDLEIIEEKIREAEELARQPQPRATMINIGGSYTVYQQEQWNYCVPACIKSTLQFINGYSPSQSQIASDLDILPIGVVTTKIAPYLNSKISGFTYVQAMSPTKTNMVNWIYSTVSNKKPPSMSIVNLTGQNWHYSTEGHRLNIVSIYTDKSIIEFADPLGQTQNGWPYYYTKTADVAHSVCRDVIW